MTMMREFLTIGLLVVAAAPLTAQGRSAMRPLQGQVTPLARQVDAALRRQQQLGLETDQVAALEAIRSDLDRVIEDQRTLRETMRAQRGERPESAEERREWQRANVERQLEMRAQLDTTMAELQTRFEAALPPLQRRELARAVRPTRAPEWAERAGPRSRMRFPLQAGRWRR